jgi:hypothetical protein
VRGALLALALAGAAWGQMAQNPSPMVEHTRPHPRLKEQHPAGRRETLELGSLYLPPGRQRALLFFFHGGTWLPEAAAARERVAVVTVQAGAGSGTYARLFEDPKRFARLLAEAESKSGAPFRPVFLGGWSAGCGALREILKSPDSYARVAGVVCIDGIHTDYVDGKPGPFESKIGTENLRIWEQVGRDAVAGRKRVLITHSEIFPGTFASTTETADYLLGQLGVPRRVALKPGPMGLQQLSEARSGSFRLLGFAGNSAPDHVDQLHALETWLEWLTRR